VADLFDVDGAGEVGFLSVEALQLEGSVIACWKDLRLI
jgi:hypothetical protein